MKRAGLITLAFAAASVAVGIAWPVARAVEVYGEREHLDGSRESAAAAVLAALAAETEAYAVYLNAPRDLFDADELALLNTDTEKARAAMETAWLEQKRLMS